MATTPSFSAPSVRVRPLTNYNRLLGETAYLLLRDVDPNTMAQAVYSKLTEYLPVDAYVHYLLAPDGSHLQLAAAGGRASVRAHLGPTLELGQAVCGTVAKTCEWMHVQDVQGRTDEMTGLIRSLGFRAYTCQPLFARGKLLGTFSFGCTTRDSFAKEELDIFQLVAEQIATATDRRLQTERILQLEREATVGRITATLAHEINNPLESLTNLLYLLRDGVDTDDGRALVATAEEEVSRLAEMTQRTLRLARGGGQSQTSAVQVDALLKDIAGSLKLPKGVPLVTEFEGDLRVEVVPGELRQAVYNLLLNAAHFTPVGGRVALVCERRGEWAEIRVSDEGQGISEESRPNIFQPYYTTRGQGTGLGLWASRGLMQRYGGDITFESDPAMRPGTTFTVSLPLVQG